MAFATPDDLRVELGISSFTEDQEARALLRLDGATAAIQRYCRQTIEYVASDVVKLTGTWSRGLVLPELPVTAVSSVVVDGDTLTSGTDYEWDNQRTLWRKPTEWRWSDWSWRYPAPSDWDSHWGGPSTAITVTYSHGFSTLPGEVVSICIQAAARGWSAPGGESRLTIGSWSVAYGPEAAGGVVALTREERRILNELRRRWTS